MDWEKDMLGQDEWEYLEMLEEQAEGEDRE